VGKERPICMIEGNRTIGTQGENCRDDLREEGNTAVGGRRTIPKTEERRIFRGTRGGREGNMNGNTPFAHLKEKGRDPRGESNT